MCPTLAMTTSLNQALGMSIAVFAVLLMSNILISATRKFTPDEIRLPIYIIIIATLVSIVGLVLKAYAYSTYYVLGAFLNLIVVNCIILGRAEAFAGKNTVIDSILDACGIALGYALGLFIIATLREFLATGGLVLNVPLTDIVIFNTRAALSDDLLAFFDTVKISIFAQPAGAFFTLGLVIAAVSAIRTRAAKKTLATKGGK
jgi:electron transport complex protein RnfE